MARPRCPERTKAGTPCTNPARRGGPDPDGVLRCIRHSKSEEALALRERQGRGGALSVRAREEIERRRAGVPGTSTIAEPSKPSAPTVDFSSPEAVRKTLEASVAYGFAMLPPAEAIKAAAAAARALLANDAVKPAAPERPPGPRVIRHVVVRNDADVVAVEREQAKQEAAEQGVSLDDEDDEGDAAVGLH